MVEKLKFLPNQGIFVKLVLYLGLGRAWGRMRWTEEIFHGKRFVQFIWIKQIDIETHFIEGFERIVSKAKITWHTVLRKITQCNIHVYHTKRRQQLNIYMLKINFVDLYIIVRLDMTLVHLEESHFIITLIIQNMFSLIIFSGRKKIKSSFCHSGSNLLHHQICIPWP